MSRLPALSTRVLKALGIVFAFFSATSGFFQALELSAPYRIATLALTLVFGAGTIVVLRMVKAHANAITAVRRIVDQVPRSTELRVGPIQDEAQLRELWELDTDSYGPASIDFKLFSTWWGRYNSGVHALFSDDRIVGGFGLWPLCQKPFQDLLSGIRRERDLTARAIESARLGRPLKCWYISGIVLNTTRRKTEAVRVLLAGCLAHWLQVIGTAPHVSVCALAMSPDGEMLLRRFQFHCYRRAEESIERFPVYARLRATPDELEHLLRHLDGQQRNSTPVKVAAPRAC
jgi:hypothetical protein